MNNKCVETFSIGTKFIPNRGKKEKLTFSIIDIHRTYDSKHNLVNRTYVAECVFMNQTIRKRNVLHTTVLMSEIIKK